MKKMAVMMFLGLFLLAGSVEITLAQGKYPARAIDIIVPYSPGGGTDIMFRNIEKIITQYKLVPQPINIVNKGGRRRGHRQSLLPFPAGGRLLPSPALILGPSPSRSTGRPSGTYRKDFTYIARLVSDINLLIVRSDSPSTTPRIWWRRSRKRGRSPFPSGGRPPCGRIILPTSN